jgi:carboxylesterase
LLKNSEISLSYFFRGPEHLPFHLEGGDRAALLIHGFPGSPAEMRPLGEALHAEGWTVEGILLPGFGREVDTLVNRRHTEWQDAVESALQSLQMRYKTVLLAGFSMGAALALAAAARIKPDGLILMTPFLKLSGALWAALPLLRYTVPIVYPFRLVKVDFNDPRVRRGMAVLAQEVDLNAPEVQAAMRDFAVPVKLFAEIRAVGLQAWRAAVRVNCPTLVLQGLQDDLVLPAHTRRLLSRLGGRLSYRELNAAHDLPDRNAPAWPAVRAAVLEFAAGVEAVNDK